MQPAYATRDRLRTLPFVTHAAVTTVPQFSGKMGTTLVFEGDTLATDGRGPWMYGAGGGYFETLGLRVLKGRTFTDFDDRATGEPVVVLVSRSRVPCFATAKRWARV